MKRKLVKQGAATLMVSLPSKWLRETGLGKGDDVEVEVSDKSLIINLVEAKKPKQVEIRLQDLTESSIRTLITNTYRKGYDKIIVNFENNSQLKILENTIRTKLIGFDIVKKEKNKCIVENITEPSSDQFDNILAKMFMNIETLLDITEARLKGTKPEENFEEVEQRIMQYDNFCRRIIAKRKLSEEKTEFFWAFLHLIDHGNRELYHLNKALGNFKVSEKSKELLQGCRKMFSLVKEAFLKKDTAILSKIHSLNKELVYNKGYNALEKSKTKEAIIIYHLIAAIRKYFQTNSPLTGLLL